LPISQEKLPQGKRKEVGALGSRFSFLSYC